MLGTIVNTLTIICGSIAGSVARRSIKPKYQGALYNAMGLAALVLGINASVSHFSQSKYPVLFIVSLALGGLIGTVLRLDERFQHLVTHFSTSRLAEGLSTGVLLYCVGTLSIVGPMMSALYGDNTYLFTNATLDLVTSAVLASTYGIGMVWAAPVLFCWQGSIYMISKYLSSTFISTDLVTELSIVGGVLIAGSGLSILKIKDCKMLNMLPALFVPIIFFVIKALV
jgi:uncharacterized membrane protein YqgA involved in biofilm formation